MRNIPPPHVTNERIKSLSRGLFQLGTVLLGASVAKVYAAGNLTPETAGWLFGALVVIWFGWLILGLLESEK